VPPSVRSPAVAERRDTTMSDQIPGPDDVTQVVPTLQSSPAVTDGTVAAPLTPAPVVPVAATTSGPKPSRGRWAAALIAAGLIVALTAGLVAALVGRSPDATVMGYVPSGTVVYGEVRLDLPGDQRQAVGQFLSHFPGFADQSALDTKLDEALDRLVADATKDQQTYTKDIKPWFGGELAMSVGPLPDPSSLKASGSAGAMDTGRALALLSIKDPTAAQAWFDAAFKGAGASPTTETYGGTTMTVFSSSKGPKAAFAIIDGKVAVAGTLDGVKAAIDTKGNSGFKDDPDVKAALDSAKDDHLAFGYVALKSMLDWTQQVGATVKGQLGSAAPDAAMTQTMLKFVPDWGASWLRVENDALVMEATSPKTASTVGPTQDRSSEVTKHVPSSAVVVATANDVGKTVQGTLDLYKGDASLKDVTDKVDQALGVLGGAENAIGWIGDSAFVVDHPGDAIDGGLVILPTDAKAAGSFFTSIKNLASLSGAAGVTFSERDHGGTTITVATIDLAGLAGSAPVQAFKMPISKIELAWATTGDVVVIGSSPGFVERVLDTTDGTSIASNDRYKGLMGRVGTGTSSLFVDITAIRGVAENFMKGADATALKGYETDVKPFLTPFDALAASHSVGSDVNRSTVIITVK